MLIKLSYIMLQSRERDWPALHKDIILQSLVAREQKYSFIAF